MTAGFEVAETFRIDNRPRAHVVGRLVGGAVARHGDSLVDGDFRARIESVGVLQTAQGDHRLQLVIDIPEGHELQPGQVLAIESPAY